MKGMECLTGLLRKPAQLLANRHCRDGVSGKGRLLNEEIRAISGSRQEAVNAYYVRKYEEVLLTAVILLLCCIAAVPWILKGPAPVPEGKLSRNTYGGTDRTEELLLAVEGESEQLEASATVQGRQYTRQEVRELLADAAAEFETVYLGKNKTADAVRENLCFPESLQEGTVKVSYVLVPFGLVSEEGVISDSASEEGTDLTIQADFTCQGESEQFTCAVRVYPPARSHTEELLFQVRKALEEADEQSSQTPWLQLPDRIAGKQVTWYGRRTPFWLLLLLMLVILPPAVAVAKDNAVHAQAKARREQLTREYPELLWKMTMLLGAGLTIRGTFLRIESDYAKQPGEEQGGRFKKRRKKEKNWLWEEMTRSCREMRNGGSEAAVYEQFGRRCALPEYVRLGTVLSQNLRKGDAQLAALLEKEAVLSLQMQKNEVRKRGERAGVQMLFPMILMLGVVLAVLMVPALMSM